MSNEIKKWKELSREVISQRYGRRTEKVTYQLPSGEKKDFYIRKEKPAVAVVALTKNQQVILAKQFRPGPAEVLLELPGGYIDANETPEAAIERELMEETGYKGKVQFITRCYDDAYSNMNRFCFAAIDCEKMRNPKSNGSEFTKVELLSLEEFKMLLRSGKMTDVEVGYLGLDYLGLL